MANSRKSTAKSKIIKPVWLKYTEKEIKEIIINLAKKDNNLTAEKIGLVLRDTYGIPKVGLYGLKIGEVLKEANLYKSPDMENLSKKVAKLEGHIIKNQQDKKTKRSLIISKAKQKKVREYLEKSN